MHDLRVAVELSEQKLFEFAAACLHPGAESHQRPGQTGFGQREHTRLSHSLPRGVNHVIHLVAQHAADGFVQNAARFGRQARMLAQGLLVVVRKHLHLQKLLHADQPRTHAIVDVVRVVGDRIGQVAQLRLQAGLGAVDEAPPHPAGLGLFQMLGIGP